MATTPATQPITKRRYRVLRVPLTPYQDIEDQMNAISNEGYELKSTIPDGSMAMICVFQLE